LLEEACKGQYSDPLLPHRGSQEWNEVFVKLMLDIVYSVNTFSAEFKKTPHSFNNCVLFCNYGLHIVKCEEALLNKCTVVPVHATRAFGSMVLQIHPLITLAQRGHNLIAIFI
jgi:hypothetical protein